MVQGWVVISGFSRIVFQGQRKSRIFQGSVQGAKTIQGFQGLPGLSGFVGYPSC